jgi:hypothetical protein
MEKPRFRWLGDTEDAFREPRVKRWRRKANTREDWTSILKEDKV